MATSSSENERTPSSSLSKSIKHSLRSARYSLGNGHFSWWYSKIELCPSEWKSYQVYINYQIMFFFDGAFGCFDPFDLDWCYRWPCAGNFWNILNFFALREDNFRTELYDSGTEHKLYTFSKPKLPFLDLTLPLDSFIILAAANAISAQKKYIFVLFYSKMEWNWAFRGRSLMPTLVQAQWK